MRASNYQTAVKMMGVGINYFHILFVAPLLGWIAHKAYTGQQLGEGFGIFLAFLVILIIAYHSYLIYVKSQESFMRIPRDYKQVYHKPDFNVFMQ